VATAGAVKGEDPALKAEAVTDASAPDHAEPSAEQAAAKVEAAVKAESEASMKQEAAAAATNGGAPEIKSELTNGNAAAAGVSQDQLGGQVASEEPQSASVKAEPLHASAKAGMQNGAPVVTPEEASKADGEGTTGHTGNESEEDSDEDEEEEEHDDQVQNLPKHIVLCTLLRKDGSTRDLACLSNMFFLVRTDRSQVVEGVVLRMCAAGCCRCRQGMQCGPRFQTTCSSLNCDRRRMAVMKFMKRASSQSCETMPCPEHTDFEPQALTSLAGGGRALGAGPGDNGVWGAAPAHTAGHPGRAAAAGAGGPQRARVFGGPPGGGRPRTQGHAGGRQGRALQPRFRSLSSIHRSIDVRSGCAGKHHRLIS
jgi:hypothetical protein